MSQKNYPEKYLFPTLHICTYYFRLHSQDLMVIYSLALDHSLKYHLSLHDKIKVYETFIEFLENSNYQIVVYRDRIHNT